MRTIIITSLTLSAGLLLLAGCSTTPENTTSTSEAANSDAEGYPLTVENCGVDLTIDTPPQRIVTLEQTLTELALALGLEDRMVGTSYLTDPILPEFEDSYESVPVLADLYPSQEVVLQERPDFIYAPGAYSVGADQAGTRASYADLGVPVYLTPTNCEDKSQSIEATTFDGFFDEIRTAARIFDVPDKGEQLIASQQARIDTVLADPIDSAEDVSFVWWYAGTDTPYFGAKGSDADNYAELLGISNAFSDGGPDRWSSTSWEVIAERDPDVIVLADLTRGNDGDSAQSKIDYLKSNPATASLSAVVNDRFIVVPASARGYSVRTVVSLELLSEGLHDFYDAP